MPRLTSSAIERIEHDESSGLLAIWFRQEAGRQRGPYLFQDVPRHLYEQFLLSRSPGGFYNRRIKDRFERLPAQEGPQEEIGEDPSRMA
ncbi:KTSC domain-containing protein [Roseomonas gilardii]|uniref:KTSC domain-containing protein n=1 Tax=Roseomonas gilardii TaxID=257708 RepID=UPI0004AE90AA|nr:KTSC domain-containing protein [Roseomonas gilardii]SUE62522.1 Uncharacterised protein [Roseomonas gilardii subsp. rosea]